VLTAACLLPLRRQGLMVSDEGWYLHPVLRMLGGEVLYRDVWTFYAPLQHHLLAGVFALSGPSLLLARSLLAVVVVGSVVLLYRVARRFAPPGLACVPAAVLALVPGPWHKAFYGFVTLVFFAALARVLERPGGRRFTALGLAAGLTLVTRQELGLVQVALAFAFAAAPLVLPARLRFEPALSAREVARRVGLVAAGIAAPVVPVYAWYAAQGALGDLLEANFVRAFLQMGTHPSGIRMLLDPGNPLGAPEGRVAGFILLLPLLVYLAAAAALLLRLRRGPPSPRTALLAAVLATGVATLGQAWLPLLLIRLLQSAVPFYLVACAGAAFLADLAARSAGTRARLARGAVLAASAGAGAALCGFVIAGPQPILPFDEYSGSARARHLRAPVEVLGDTVFADWGVAEEVRLVRAFFDAHVGPQEPILAVPVHSLYWVLLGRPNPTRILGEHITPGDHVLSGAMKREEMARLLASPARFVVAGRGWWRSPQPPEAIRAALFENFRALRAYGSAVILVREPEARRRTWGELQRRLDRAPPEPGDEARLREWIAEEPAEPLPWQLLGHVLLAGGRPDEAVAALQEAARLDPADATPLEWAAEVRLAQGRPDAAAQELRRARAVRQGPSVRRIAARLPEPLRSELMR
jgi:hypothetical protein